MPDDNTEAIEQAEPLAIAAVSTALPARLSAWGETFDAGPDSLFRVPGEVLTDMERKAAFGCLLITRSAAGATKDHRIRILVGEPEAVGYGDCPAKLFEPLAPDGFRIVFAFFYTHNGTMFHRHIMRTSARLMACGCKISDVQNWLEDRCFCQVFGDTVIASLTLHEVVSAKKGNRIQIRAVGSFQIAPAYALEGGNEFEVSAPAIILDVLEIQERRLEIKATCLHVFAQSFFDGLVDEMWRLWGEAAPPAAAPPATRKRARTKTLDPRAVVARFRADRAAGKVATMEAWARREGIAYKTLNRYLNEVDGEPGIQD